MVGNLIKDRRSKITLLNVTFAFLLLLGSYAKTFANDLDTLTAEEIQWIKEHPVLRATNEMNWAPIDFARDGVAKGFSVDYLNLVASKVGLEIEYINGYTWGELVEMVRNREIDIAQSITQTKGREEFLNFTQPYLDVPKVYYGRVGSERIEKIEDLNDKKIGLISEWASSGIFKENYPHLDTYFYSNVKDALIAVAAGEIDVFSNRLPVTNYIIAENLITGLEVIGNELFPEINGQNYLRMASRNDWPLLDSILQKGMAAVTPAEFRAISEKWSEKFEIKNSIGLTMEEMEWLSENSVINVIVDQTMAPYEFVDDNGNIAGIIGGYYDLIGEKLGIKFHWSGNKDWNDAAELLNSGEASVISGMVPTPEREKAYHFTPPYMESTSAIFTRKEGEFYGNMDGLRGKKIAQERSFALTAFIKRDYPDIEIIEVENAPAALKMVSSGLADAYVGDITTTAYHIATNHMSQIVVAGETPYTTDMVMAINLNQPILASAMRKAFATITDIEKTEISTKWLAINVNESINKELISKIIAGALVVILVFYLWATSLQREIKMRELVQAKLIKAEKEASAANEAKSAFLANMSHEIRTPLNAIIGFSEVMTQNIYGEKMPSRYQEYLGDIESSGRHLASVINNILDLSKIEAGKWNLDERKFSLGDCTQSAVMMLETMARSKGVSLDFVADEFADVTVIADETAIKRIIINLISNAVKFTEEGGNVSCYIRLNEFGGAELTVKDTGIGIPEDKIEHVLTPFGQDAAAQVMVENGNGTGLGLSIVKQLAEMHGGSFNLESKYGQGTSAIFTIPSERVMKVDNVVSMTKNEIMRTA